MGNFTYLTDTDNVATGATIVASSADANYPVANVKALPVSKPFRFTGKTSENLQIDLTAAKLIECVAILNHNMSSTATITLNGGTTSNPDGTQYTTTIAWRQYDAFKLISQTDRYWKIIFADSNCPQSFIQVGYLMMGDSVTLATNFAPGWNLIDEHTNLELETEFGVPHVAELFYRVHLQLPWKTLSTADATTMRTLQRALKRNVTPILVIPDSAGTDAWFCRSMANLETRIDFYRDLDFEFLEESRGRFIAS